MRREYLVALIIAILILGGFFIFSKDNNFVFGTQNIELCIEKGDKFFKRMNTEIDSELDYSYADNTSALIAMLGDGYKHIAYADGNCYAVVKNYNPLIHEYRYSILNIDLEKLDPVLLDHDLQGSSSVTYREEFFNRYKQIFVEGE